MAVKHVKDSYMRLGRWNLVAFLKEMGCNPGVDVAPVTQAEFDHVRDNGLRTLHPSNQQGQQSLICPSHMATGVVCSACLPQHTQVNRHVTCCIQVFRTEEHLEAPLVTQMGSLRHPICLGLHCLSTCLKSQIVIATVPC